MRLKKIRLAGFKSFVDPTNIPFPGDMTAVVGPNGCGKSNIIDAVRWVLGESSAKNLRGDAMTDVIFNGSSTRKPVSQCSVELVFDNTSKRIGGEFAAYGEISVKRVVTKEAVSSYLLNGSKCRRRDITDLFLGTGLGPRSYAIIEQGMISKLIESKPQELRVFIEEAAGISKYKERRKETLNRIKHTKENLERLEDVRQELGEQIAKLQRQASAANRYKELKREERRLKAQLATLKWQVQSQIMNDAQTCILHDQTLLENLVISQQGDQSQMQALKNQISVSKLTCDDIQQQLFNSGGEITKLEQSQLFVQKRVDQIQAEIAQIKRGEASLLQTLNDVEIEITQAENRRNAVEPEKDLTLEQLHELEDKKLDAETRLEVHLGIAKAAENAFYNETQILQQKNSQIQQLISLQARTQSRLTELAQELDGLDDDSLTTTINELGTARTALNEVLVHIEQEQDTLSRSLQTCLDDEKEAQQFFDISRTAVLNIEATLSALEALQRESEPNADPKNQAIKAQFDAALSGLSKQTLWDFFEVQSGGEKMLNSALSDITPAWVIDTALTPEGTAQWHDSVWQHTAQSLLFKQSFTDQKTTGTLASLLINKQVPHIFNHYFIATDSQHALLLLADLNKSDRVITSNGNIYGHDTFVKHQHGDNKIARAAQIKLMREQHSECRSTQSKAQVAFDQCALKAKEHKQALSALQERLSTRQQEQQSIEIEYRNMCYQQQQNSQRKEKLVLEIQQHEERSAQESTTVETLEFELEDANEALFQREDEKILAVKQTENLRVEQQQWQAQYSQMQTSVHEHTLLIQQIRNGLQILHEQQRNKQQQLNSSAEKLNLLQLEAQELLLPQEAQQHKLQQLLDKQQILREAQTLERDKLAEHEIVMTKIEKGQHGTLSQMDAVKAQIESQRIVFESANVRAQACIEQLNQSEDSLKKVIETLPNDANEKEWQTELSKVSAYLARLGAVNLAAVDEYETQSARKEHLDAQNLDLTQALDTLESAMRKIDKETRRRFKYTFDAVNSDLKDLFPKVFGGGMAYLMLNDDDMLDTGVTIMARPPGKKNSTIGLLSGGEKALTALSLVFAIFRLNPAPFCLLDEVDAPLDDANVGRFCRLVSQMSESVQFIYITHNKVAMEMASHLTGVTMAEPGVSRMVAVDMEQALAIAQ